MTSIKERLIRSDFYAFTNLLYDHKIVLYTDH